MTMQARTAPTSGEPAAPSDPVEQEAGDEADHGGEDRHPATGGAVGAGGAGEHADREADSEVGEKVHVRKPNRARRPRVDPPHFQRWRKSPSRPTAGAPTPAPATSSATPACSPSGPG